MPPSPPITVMPVICDARAVLARSMVSAARSPLGPTGRSFGLVWGGTDGGAGIAREDFRKRRLRNKARFGGKTTWPWWDGLSSFYGRS